MRILVLSQQPGVGGAERLAFSALALRPELDVTVVAPASQCKLAESFGLKTVSLELPRVRTPLLGVLHLVRGAWTVARLCRKTKADLLYANAIRAMGYSLGARLLGGPPVLVHDHHLLARGDVTLIDRGLLNRGALVWSLERLSRIIVVPSEAAARAFRDRKKVFVVPNGVDLSRFKPPDKKSEAKARFGFDADQLVVGTVTRADPDKGMSSFVSLANILSSRVPNAVFLLAGGASFPHEHAHFDDVKSRTTALRDKIRVTDIVEETASVFQALDVMVHLSELPETFGLTAAEAMACGVPVVGYRWGGLTEVVEDGETGFLVGPRDVNAVADGVEKLLGDEALRNEMGLSSRRRCESHFDLRRLAADISELIHSAAEA